MEDFEHNISKRLAKIKGQINSLEKNINAEQSLNCTSCQKNLQQINAVLGALESVKKMMIEESFKKCSLEENSVESAQNLIKNIKNYI